MTGFDDEEVEEVEIHPHKWSWWLIAGMAAHTAGNCLVTVGSFLRELDNAFSAHVLWTDGRAEFESSVMRDIESLPTTE